MENEKWKFLNNEILSMSIIASLTRGYSIYKPEVKDKENFKESLKEKLEKYASKYKFKIDSIQHIKNIESLADEISKEFGQILKNDRFKIGRAQKILNLYLKYLWVLDKILEPPHCPFDSSVISNLKLNISWTKLDSIDEYKNLVQKAHEESQKQDLSIPEWELELWNKRTKKLFEK